MDDSILFSVIVPIYNSERFLRDCLDSILNQHEKSFELLLINDGSTDNSKTICEEYVSLYNNVKYFEIQNSGVSVARNKGIMEAVGKYILLCDSDDYWDPALLSTLKPYVLNGKYDVIHFGTIIDKYDGSKLINAKTKAISKGMEIHCNEWKQQYSIYWNSNLNMLSSCDKAFRRETVVTNKCLYHEKQAVLEDFDFVIQVYRHAGCILAIPEALYHIRRIENEPQIMHRKNPSLVEDIDYSMRSFLCFCEEKKISLADFPQMNEFVFNTFCWSLDRIQGDRAGEKTVIDVLKKLFNNSLFKQNFKQFAGKKLKCLNVLCTFKMYSTAAYFIRNLY